MPMIPVPKAVLAALHQQADKNNGVVSVQITGLLGKDGDLEAVKLNNETIPGYEEDAKDMDSGAPTDEEMEDKNGTDEPDQATESDDSAPSPIMMAFRKHVKSNLHKAKQTKVKKSSGAY